MIEVHRKTDGKPIYINIDYIESVGTDHNEPNLTVINLRDRNGIDCIEETLDDYHYCRDGERKEETE